MLVKQIADTREDEKGAVVKAKVRKVSISIFMVAVLSLMLFPAQAIARTDYFPTTFPVSGGVRDTEGGIKYHFQAKMWHVTETKKIVGTAVADGNKTIPANKVNGKVELRKNGKLFSSKSAWNTSATKSHKVSVGTTGKGTYVTYSKHNYKNQKGSFNQNTDGAWVN